MVNVISVIIPVYNAEKYVGDAINSATRLSEVLEAIVIDDGSTDNSLKIIEEIAKETPKVKVLHHGNFENKGRSASRNLGVKNAKGGLIAFLDADDVYLEDRFVNDVVVFQSNKEIDGIYNAIGVEFYRKSTEQEKKKLALTTVSEIIEPEDLFEALFYGGKGYFSIDGLTLKSSVFKEVGFFNENLPVAEDTELFLRIASICKLKTGIINKPMALRGVHNDNVFNNENLYEETTRLLYQELFIWTKTAKVDFQRVDEILKRLWLLYYKEEQGILLAVKYWAFLFRKNPKYMFSALSLKYFPVVRLRKKLFSFLYS